MTSESRIPDLDPRLRERIAALPEEVPPARDLWPAIRAQLEAERVKEFPGSSGAPVEGRARVSARRLPGWAVAAAAGLALVAGTAVVTARLVRGPAPDVAVVDTLPAPSADALAAYERSAAELAATLGRRAPRLDAETRATLERSLRTIDAAIEEARAELARDPANAGIRAFVEAAYRQKIDFLRRANDVANLWEI